MDIQQLRSFLTLAHVGHSQRAAQVLELEETDLRRQMTDLESELKIQLFEWVNQSLRLTHAGQLLIAPAELSLLSLIDLDRTARQLRGDVYESIKLGTILEPTSLRLGHFLVQLRHNAPRLDVSLTHGISGWIFEQVLTGMLDAGFFMGRIENSKVACLELRNLNYLVVGPPSWASKIASASFAELAKMPWIGTTFFTAQSRIVKELFLDQGLQYSAVVEVDQESQLTSLVSCGVGMCLMREELAHPAQAKGEIVIWPKLVRTAPLSLVYLRSREEDSGLQRLLSTLKQVWLST